MSGPLSHVRALDLAIGMVSPKGQALIRRLAAQADVVALRQARWWDSFLLLHVG